MSNKYLPLIAVLLLLFPAAASAKLSVKQPCSDGMILQQKTNATVWGHATPGIRVSVTTSWDGKTYEADTDGRGIWKAQVATPEASYTRYEITIKGDGGQFTISDILIGEVWIASGQSNMEMPLRGYYNCPVEGSSEVIAGTLLKDKVRMFSVGQDQSDDPLNDLRSSSGWIGAEGNGLKWMSATAFFFARELQRTLDVPVGIVSFPYGGTRVESWLPREILEEFGEPLGKDEVYPFHNPFRMYNAMQRPLQGYTARGFIWYQGCSNVSAHEVFVTRMTALVSRWRSDWGDTDASMPFYQVEIAPNIYDRNATVSNAALLRQAQHRAAATIPNSAIVVTNDLVYPHEFDQIHPCRKQEVGQRLAWLALNRDYGFSHIACYSPEAVEAGKNGESVWVRLSNCPNGLDRWHGIEGLEASGPDGLFFPITDAYFGWDGILRMSCASVPDPVEVRYGWGDFRPGNLHNTEGLPVSPFDIKLQ